MRSLFKRHSKNESGIALLLVLGAIVVLTMLTVEFAYNAQVEYHLAHRQKERLQAYYLAQSAYQLTLLELKMGAAVQGQVARATGAAGVDLPIDLSAPLCEQFPIKTALFRMLMTGETGGEEGEEEALPEGMAGFMGLSLSGLEEFLQFEGDFDAECSDESGKIDLNFFYGQDPGAPVPEGQRNLYDQYKQFLARFFAQPKFAPLFAESETPIEEVVRNLADWIDPNDVINEMEGGQGGSEESVYRNTIGPWQVKNGKLSTPGEIYQIAGVKEVWWEPLSDYFTIYGTADQRGNPQINVCRAPEEVTQTLILRYLEMRKDLPPIPPGNTEILAQLVEAVQGGCTGVVPDKNKIAQELDAKLLELLKVAPVAEVAPGEGAPGYGPSGSPFADWIAAGPRFYRLQIAGQVRDTRVGVEAVMDVGQAGGADPAQWRLVYWKVH